MEKISVIVPIYNSEKYLRECLDSIRNQEYSNLEIIMINDGSTDNSMNICEEYTQIDARFILINQNNKGASEARNNGLRMCSGELVSFVDSDDTVSQEFLSSMYHSLKEYGADIAMCDFQIDGKKEHLRWDKKIFEKYEIFSGFLRGEFCNRIVNKLYKREVVEGIMFPSDRNIMEDANWTALVLERCGRIVRIPDDAYVYRYVATSLTHRKLNGKEECGSYRNFVEKLLIIELNISEKEDYQRLFKVTQTIAHRALVSYDDLRYFEVYEKMQILIKRVTKHVKEKSILLDIVLNSESYKKAQNRYFWQVLMGRDIPLIDKVKIIYRRMSRHK